MTGWQTMETAPARGEMWGWCVFGAGSEARIVRREGPMRFIAYGVTQTVIYWQPLVKPAPPVLAQEPSA